MDEIRTFVQNIHGFGGTQYERFVHMGDYTNLLRKIQVKLLKEEQTEFIQGQLDMLEQGISDIELIEKLSKEK
jgi:hypothetical protein